MKTLPPNFAVFIISHGRPDKIYTFSLLRRRGYSGPIYIIIDNLDSTADQYFEKYGRENVIVFDKLAMAGKTDNGDNFENYRSTTHARNACYEVAEKIGMKYFLVLDDDYTNFQYKFNSKFEFSLPVRITNIGDVFASVLDFYIKTPQIRSIALSQAGDHIGGSSGGTNKKGVSAKRKAMNSWFCSIERPIKFVSRLNEDVNTYLRYGSTGSIFLSIQQVSLTQVLTQLGTGGMSDAYLESGTYVKSFYSVMYQPSSVKIWTMGWKQRRIHHKIEWKKTVPMILREEHRKPDPA